MIGRVQHEFGHKTASHDARTIEEASKTRFVFVFLMVGALLAGVPDRACRADPPTPKGGGLQGSNAKAIAAQLLLSMSVEAAEFVAKAILSEVMKDLRQGKYTAKPVAVIQVPDTLGRVWLCRSLLR